jgi:UDP-N-acetylmuramoylalanine--D-glutamate ligase
MKTFSFDRVAGKSILVLGAGETGRSAVRWFRGKGADVCIWDSQKDTPNLSYIGAHFPEVRCLSGNLPDLELREFLFVVVSPGIPLPEGFINRAASQDVAILGDVEIFLEINRTDLRAKVVAITGTNGKTTVTSMVAQVLNANSISSITVGNIGVPVLDVLSSIKQGEIEKPEVFVLEISSFQLALANSFSSDVSVVTNISEDHLDRHGSMSDYVAAKSRVFMGTGTPIVNRDDPLIMNMFPESGQTISVGVGAPTRDHEWGIQQKRGEAWLSKFEIPLIRCADLKVIGIHNQLNALIALAICDCIVPTNPTSLEAICGFIGLDHRMQLVSFLNGIRFINDSKGTNVGATRAALSSMEGGCVLIVGGLSKGQDFSHLLSGLEEKTRAVVLFGQDKERIRESLCNFNVELALAGTLADAVSIAVEKCETGDTVLFSPACASFDMFKDYQDRGRVFSEIVRGMKN